MKAAVCRKCIGGVSQNPPEDLALAYRYAEQGHKKGRVVIVVAPSRS